MKYKKTFYALCATIFLGCITSFILIILEIFKKINMSIYALVGFCVTFLVFLVWSFICGSILSSLHEDWKWRHVKKNDKWKR